MPQPPDPAKALQKLHDERLKRVTPWFMCKPGPAVDTEDVVVNGRDGPIPARVYTRPGTRPGAPAILFIHGGAFIDLGVDFCDSVQRGLAQRTGYVVVGLSYRLAPEHPFPAGLRDCIDVLQWMHDARPGGLDPQRIAVGGESAGGNLTVALCLRGLPPATVVTCGHDVLHSDGVRLVEALRAAGVEILHTHYDDMPHGFLLFSRLTRRAGESMDEMAREVTKRLGGAAIIAI